MFTCDAAIMLTHLQQVNVMKGMRAKQNIHMYRNPAYRGGLCSVCRKRQRAHGHPDYPHMCDHCRETRVGSKRHYGLTPEQLEYDRKLEEEYARGVQNLNASTPIPPSMTPAQAALFEKLKHM